MTFDPCQPCAKLALDLGRSKTGFGAGSNVGWLASERVSQLAGHEYGRTRGRQADGRQEQKTGNETRSKNRLHSYLLESINGWFKFTHKRIILFGRWLGASDSRY